jgi:hypothetical protein
MPHLGGTHRIEGLVGLGGPVWMGAENLSATKIQSPECPTPSELLYRLCYPSPLLSGKLKKIIWNCLHGYYVQFIKLLGGHKEATSCRCLPKRQRMKQQLMEP